jgi:uncharacterized RDD family membrane protein YckC
VSSQQPSGIVTPEAVLLEFETAGVGSRTAAELIDVAVQLTLLLLMSLAVSFLAGVVGGGSGVVAAILFLVLTFLVILGYPVAFESLWNGRTLGKAALGLRVVTVEGGPVRFRHAAIRGILGLFSLWITFGSVAVLSVILTARNQRLGDLAAGTLVLRERTASATAAMAMSFPAPRGYEAYVTSIDVSALTSDQYGVIRSFLIRVLDLTLAARSALAVSLANRTAEQLHHTPPPGVAPEIFLACVAAAYQIRHGGPAPATFAPPPSFYPRPSSSPPPPPPPAHAYPQTPPAYPQTPPAYPQTPPAYPPPGPPAAPPGWGPTSGR